MVDVYAMIICELSLLLGAFLGFIIGICIAAKNENTNEYNKERQEKKLREKKIERKSEFTVINDSKKKGVEKKAELNDNVDLAKKIPSKDITWTDTSCGSEGTETKECIKKQRATEDNSYEILSRKKKKE